MFIKLTYKDVFCCVNLSGNEETSCYLLHLRLVQNAEQSPHHYNNQLSLFYSVSLSQLPFLKQKPRIKHTENMSLQLETNCN